MGHIVSNFEYMYYMANIIHKCIEERKQFSNTNICAFMHKQILYLLLVILLSVLFCCTVHSQTMFLLVGVLTRAPKLLTKIAIYSQTPW